MPGGAYRSRPGLIVHRGLLGPDETTTVDGVRLTVPVRCASDIACWHPLVEAVVALDALSHRHRFTPAEILDLARQHHGARGNGRLPRMVRLANPLAESPMETRIRLAIVLNELPVPLLQHPVGPYVLDLAYPGIRLAIEFDGDAHRTQERVMRDLARQAYLSAAGWTVLRFTAAHVMGDRGWSPRACARSSSKRAAGSASESTRCSCTDRYW